MDTLLGPEKTGLPPALGVLGFGGSCFSGFRAFHTSPWWGFVGVLVVV